jgi:hypothetical protein
MHVVTISAVTFLLLAEQAAPQLRPPRLSPATPSVTPVCFTVLEAKAKICSDSGGRLVTATDLDGKILWQRDPFVENRMAPYRNEFPRITSIGRLSWDCRSLVSGKSCLGIGYNSSQTVVISVIDGDSAFAGQN